MDATELVDIVSSTVELGKHVTCPTLLKTTHKLTIPQPKPPCEQSNKFSEKQRPPLCLGTDSCQRKEDKQREKKSKINLRNPGRPGKKSVIQIPRRFMFLTTLLIENHALPNTDCKMKARL